MDDTEIKVYTVTEAAAALKVSKRTLNRLLASGEIRSMKVGGSRRMLQKDLLDYLYRTAGGGA